jgi:hypothetical protein
VKTHRTSTSCKIHGKRLAAFRETLAVGTGRRVAFNQGVALNSVYNPKKSLSSARKRFAISALDVSEKRARVSPFQQFSSSGIIQTPIR